MIEIIPYGHVERSPTIRCARCDVRPSSKKKSCDALITTLSCVVQGGPVLSCECVYLNCCVIKKELRDAFVVPLRSEVQWCELLRLFSSVRARPSSDEEASDPAMAFGSSVMQGGLVVPGEGIDIGASLIKQEFCDAFATPLSSEMQRRASFPSLAHLPLPHKKGREWQHQDDLRCPRNVELSSRRL